MAPIRTLAARAASATRAGANRTARAQRKYKTVSRPYRHGLSSNGVRSRTYAVFLWGIASDGATGSRRSLPVSCLPGAFAVDASAVRQQRRLGLVAHGSLGVPDRGLVAGAVLPGQGFAEPPLRPSMAPYRVPARHPGVDRGAGAALAGRRPRPALAALP